MTDQPPRPEDRPPRPARRPTLAQIAAELGVSAMTVSNAYNRPDQLSAELRGRVLATAERLGYPGPDPLARGLRRGQAGAVGVLYDTWPSFVFQDPSAVRFLGGLSSAIERSFTGLLLVPGPWPDRGEARPLDVAMVDGFVVYSVADSDPQVPEAVARRPVVIVDQPRLAGVPFVGIDDRAAAASAARHLVELGHRRIAVVTFGLARDGGEGPAGPERQASATYAVTRERLAGYRAVLEEAGIPWAQTTVFECRGSTVAMGADAGRRLLRESPSLTAVLATSDVLAAGVIEAGSELGYAVPTDLSVVGFDDAPRARFTEPPLTTIHQPHHAKGALAGKLLRALIDGEPVPQEHLLDAGLVIRGSTAPPRGADAAAGEG